MGDGGTAIVTLLSRERGVNTRTGHGESLWAEFGSQMSMLERIPAAGRSGSERCRQGGKLSVMCSSNSSVVAGPIAAGLGARGPRQFRRM
jgi:hypothetical protein